MIDEEPDAHPVPIEDTLDLHPFAPADIPSVVEEYIHAAHAAGLRELRLIHGRGIGVQRARVQQVLREHPLVESYVDAPESHLGATIVCLKTSSITETRKHKDAQGQ
jgi:DNA-nicking Smr family endonuclease